jgi:hypothetical protein
MKSLDELLADRAQAQYRDSLAEVLDPASWTQENRDSKLKEIRALAEGVCDTTEDFVKEIMATKVGDKSILWHKIKEQFISGEVELLMGFRDELDTLDTLPPDIAVSYDWLNDQIKQRYKEIHNINLEISKITSPESEVQAL